MSAEHRNARNCLLVLRNRKINNFAYAGKIIDDFSSACYYFDRVSYIAFDESDEIVRAIKDAKANYENVLIICPAGMERAVKDFVSNLYNSNFGGTDILKTDDSKVFVMYCDRANKLSVENIKSLLDERYGVSYIKSYIKTVCAPVKEVNEAIAKVKSQFSDADIIVNDIFGDCSIEVTCSDKIVSTDRDKIMRILVGELSEYLYAMDNVTLAERLFHLLKLRRMKISVAESFTGGGVGMKLVEVPGISSVYFEGLNTYSNESKMSRLKVNDCTLHQFGAVSAETAVEMAKGLLEDGNCDISIATTGIAGPASDNTSKPVGLVYIAVGTANGINVYEYNLKGGSEAVTKTAINLALFLAYKTLK